MTHNAVGNPNEIMRSFWNCLPLGLALYRKRRKRSSLFDRMDSFRVEFCFCSFATIMVIKLSLANGNFNDEDVINIVFGQSITAKFICRIIQGFVHESANMAYANAVIDEMATILRSNNMSLSRF
jgi:hypothetical protein